MDKYSYIISKLEFITANNGNTTIQQQKVSKSSDELGPSLYRTIQ